MSLMLSLDNICIGETVCVVDVRAKGSMRRRLMDIGLTEGTKVSCVGKSPGGDPLALLIRGAVIAIRKSDCRDIEVCRTVAGDE